MISTLLYVFIILCIVGVIMWGISKVPGIPEIVKTVVYVVIAVILLLWCLQFLNSGMHGVSFH
jgi:DMSO/TMAO reductase YedYZ heme-binding membrane subunit